MRTLTRVLAVLAVLMLGTVGFAQLEPTPPAEDAAFVRIAHLSPDAPAVKGFVNGDAVISGLRFGTVTRWIDLAPGSYDFAVGTAADPAAAEISGISLDLAPGSFTTLIAVGSAADGTLTGQVVTEDYGRIGTGQARVTVIHAIEGGPAVNVTAGGASVAEYLSFPGALVGPDGANDGVSTAEVAPGTGISVTAFGSGASLLENATAAIVANHNYLVVAAGTTDAPRLIVVDTDQADFSTMNMAEGSAYVRVAHFASAGPAVTIFVDGSVAFSGLRYGTVTRFIQVQPGTHEVAVSGNSKIDGAVIGPVALSFEDGKFYTIAANADADGNIFPVIIEDFTAGEGASVTIYHGIAGAPAVDILANDVAIVESLAYAGTFQLPAGGFNDGLVELDIPGAEGVALAAVVGGTTLLQTTADLVDGNYYLIAAVGTLDAPRLVFVETDPSADLESGSGL